MKFKVGDTVRWVRLGIKSLTGEILYYDDKCEYDRFLVGFRDLYGHNGESSDSKELYLKIVEKGYENHCFWLLEEDIELVQEDNKMENVKSLLKTGDTVITNNGNKYKVFNEYESKIYGKGILANFNGEAFCDIRGYDNNCICVNDNFTIKEIYRPNFDAVLMSESLEDYELIWKRELDKEIEEVKEMTMEELEKVLGYKVKIKANEER